MEKMNFDEFLADANKQASQDAEMEAYFQSLGEKFERALVQHEVPRIASTDPDIQAALMARAISEYEDALRDHAHESGDPIDSLVLEASARALAEQQMVQEHAIFLRMMMTITAYDSQFKIGNIPNQDTTDRNKKYLTADVMIEHNLTADDSMIKFMNEVIPGESLDTSSREDDTYILQAIEKHANSTEQDKKVTEITAQAIEILKTADELSTDRQKTFTQLIKTAMLHAHNGGQTSAMRQAKFDEIIRDDNLPADLASKLIQLIDKYYPIS